MVETSQISSQLQECLAQHFSITWGLCEAAPGPRYELGAGNRGAGSSESFCLETGTQWTRGQMTAECLMKLLEPSWTFPYFIFKFLWQFLKVSGGEIPRFWVHAVWVFCSPGAGEQRKGTKHRGLLLVPALSLLMVRLHTIFIGWFQISIENLKGNKGTA